MADAPILSVTMLGAGQEVDDLATNFQDGKGKVHMTHPTKAVHKFIMQDYVRMGFE
ncbi:uncharacterized protein LACBIDRAFT_300301 [Laccaria bicolor S238N-H82]|uniref:Predicted protein n=1 Tax=Laccaria bicolor (strain S238N-H82 / ATCC MYA-4686) TaxID=486041 RepID=B0DGF6_LACBS|nr:uncharacterized protein LACBIDRAFT_300301 [Laccaria bicolor S238N-H82]EDR06145.1 predicted protein [Laccaria bicolor S238N-H82]|eukprot:XP_001883006.1 predicted protein [Laccaria bicolor S238N-H82]